MPVPYPNDGRSAAVYAAESVPAIKLKRGDPSGFFFEDSLVFLAAEITSPSANPVETVVNQWPLSAATQPLALSDGSSATLPFDRSVADVSWAAADGVGYFFPGGATVHARGASRGGDWSTLGVSSGLVTQPFVTLSLDHGATPTGKAAAYAIVPNADAAAMKAYAAAPPFEIVANDATRAIVHYQHAGTEALGAALYAAGTATGGALSVRTDQPAVVYLESTGGVTSVSAADPAQSGGTFTLTFSPGAGVRLQKADPQVVVGTADGATTLTLPRDGKTYRAFFDAAGAGTDADAGPLGPADATTPGGGCACRVGGAAPDGARVVVGAIALLAWTTVRRRIRTRSRESR
jgi:hyaluronate lyase